LNPKDLVGAKKAPLGVVPPALMIAAAPAMAVGAEKYGPFNWRKQPVQAMTYVEAVMRHLYAWIDGQDNAEDTNISHIGHAIAGLGILADAMAADNLIDNRPVFGPAADMLRDQDQSGAHQDEEPMVYQSKVIPILCPECGAFPEHTLTCSRQSMSFFSDPDVEPVPEPEPWGAGDGPIYQGIPSVQTDGCYEYRGIHVHPLAATPDVFAAIDQEIAMRDRRDNEED
jgi:hypothetical protein